MNSNEFEPEGSEGLGNATGSGPSDSESDSDASDITGLTRTRSGDAAGESLRFSESPGLVQLEAAGSRVTVLRRSWARSTGRETRIATRITTRITTRMATRIAGNLNQAIIMGTRAGAGVLPARETQHGPRITAARAAEGLDGPSGALGRETPCDGRARL